MAHFKLHKQIREQIFAFNEGLKSVVKQEWLNMFSVSEIQRLISGSLHDLNLEDLKLDIWLFMTISIYLFDVVI